MYNLNQMMTKCILIKHRCTCCKIELIYNEIIICFYEKSIDLNFE